MNVEGSNPAEARNLRAARPPKRAQTLLKRTLLLDLDTLL